MASPTDLYGPTPDPHPIDTDGITWGRRQVAYNTWAEIEALAAQWERAQRVRIPPLPARQDQLAMARAKGHLHLSHGVFVGDLKTLRRIAEEHADLHADPGHIMTRPHHH